MTIELQPNEIILRHGFATHFVHMIAMTGKLFVTNNRVHFITHPLNFKRYDLTLTLADICSVHFKNNLRIFPQGILIQLRSGEEHLFAVWKRKAWKTAIEQAMQQ